MIDHQPDSIFSKRTLSRSDQLMIALVLWGDLLVLGALVALLV